MNAVQKIKERHDMGILLRAIQPRMEENRLARRAREEAEAMEKRSAEQRVISVRVRFRMKIKEVTS